MKNPLKTSVVLLLILVPGAIISRLPAMEPARFIYPKGEIITSSTPIRLTGYAGDSKGLKLAVENNKGKKTFTVKKFSGYFHIKPVLAKGENHLTLISDSGIMDKAVVFLSDIAPKPPYRENFIPFFTHPEKDITKDCSKCHPSDTKKSTGSAVSAASSCISRKCHEGFDKGSYKHGPFADGRCDKCHNPHGTENRNFLKLPVASLCFSCHTDNDAMLVDAKVVHYPVLKKQCTACHDPHKSEQEYHLKRVNMIELCAGCHGYNKTSNKVMHAPAKSGDCIACHTPHVSEFRGLLTDNGSHLCLNCHTVRKEEFESKHTHEPVAINCALCHDPHGSATKYHLRGKKDKNNRYLSSKTPIRDLCLLCHVKLNPEVAKTIKSSRIKHDPVSKDKCLICHTPHSTNFPKQLRQPLQELCFSCHKEMEKLIRGSKYKHNPVASGSCSACHSPHGADNNKLLRARFSTDYSVEFDIDKFQLCFNCHETELALDKSSEKTGFRNGKKNLHYVHVHSKKGRSCLVCHEIHASNQQLHIREVIPFTKRFNIKLRYKKMPDGGTCIKGCHKAKSYNRIMPINNK